MVVTFPITQSINLSRSEGTNSSFRARPQYEYYNFFNSFDENLSFNFSLSSTSNIGLSVIFFDDNEVPLSRVQSGLNVTIPITVPNNGNVYARIEFPEPYETNTLNLFVRFTPINTISVNCRNTRFPLNFRRATSTNISN